MELQSPAPFAFHRLSTDEDCYVVAFNYDAQGNVLMLGSISGPFEMAIADFKAAINNQSEDFKYFYLDDEE